MQPLIQQLSRWSGRPAYMALLASSGLLIPSAWEAFVAGMLNLELQHLQYYLDECAREKLTSAGRTNSITRDFKFKGSYRSAYLDDLYLRQGAAVISDLEDFYLDMKSGTEKGIKLRAQLNHAMATCKAREALAFNGSMEPLKSISDLDSMLERSAAEMGFLVKGKYWIKRHDGLEFRIWIDRGRKNTWKFSVPLMSDVRHESDRHFSYAAEYLYMLCPGLRVYELYAGPSEAALGVHAMVVAFSMLYDTIVD
jgi:hypothetical protein